MKTLTFAVAAIGIGLLGCNEPYTAPNLEEIEYNPVLEVDIRSMTRTESGLYYADLETGSGTPIVAGQTARVYYTARLSTGQLVDQRQRPSAPLDFLLGAGIVIAGWDQGVVGMSPGGIRRLVVPPSLAYGNKQRGAIPPNSVLVFTIELFGVQ